MEIQIEQNLLGNVQSRPIPIEYNKGC